MTWNSATVSWMMGRRSVGSGSTRSVPASMRDMSSRLLISSDSRSLSSSMMDRNSRRVASSHSHVLAQQSGGKALDAGQGRAQFVADGGQQLRLHLVQFFLAGDIAQQQAQAQVVAAGVVDGERSEPARCAALGCGQGEFDGWRALRISRRSLQQADSPASHRQPGSRVCWSNGSTVWPTRATARADPASPRRRDSHRRSCPVCPPGSGHPPGCS